MVAQVLFLWGSFLSQLFPLLKITKVTTHTITVIIQFSTVLPKKIVATGII